MGPFLSNQEQPHIFSRNNANVPNVIWQFNIYHYIIFVEGTAQGKKECSGSDSLQQFWHWLSLSNWSLWEGQNYFEKHLALGNSEYKWCHPLRMTIRGSGTLPCGHWLLHSHHHDGNCHKLGILLHGVLGLVWDVLPRRNAAHSLVTGLPCFPNPGLTASWSW